MILPRLLDFNTGFCFQMVGGGELKKNIVLHGHFGAPLWLYGETSVNGNRLNANEVVGKQQSVKKINCYLSGQSDVIFLC